MFDNDVKKEKKKKKRKNHEINTFFKNGYYIFFNVFFLIQKYFIIRGFGYLIAKRGKLTKKMKLKSKLKKAKNS